ncbi:MAG TPA: polysaccharide lyase family protein [Tepidisphaeraceae bacterium]|jgi:rhamnogalacturonan endolyase
MGFHRSSESGFGRTLWAAALFYSVCSMGVSASAADSGVTVTDAADSATLANGRVAVVINKLNGNMLSLKHDGVEMLSRGGGYWNIYGRTPGQPSTQQKGTPSVYRVTQDPARNGGDIGEIALLFPYTGQDKAVPLDIEIRYTLRRGDSGIYGWTIAEHASKYPPFNIEVSTVCLKLNPQVFNFLSIDARRQRLMASAQDWVSGTQLNLPEARRLNTGIRKGEVEHKYDYTMRFAETPAWGWSGTKSRVGIFVVNPSIEYLGGSVVSLDYGGHIDVKPSLPADPTLLFIWHSPHYGGREIQIKADEHWRKIVGPFLIYCTAGETPEAMWKDSLARAEVEKKAWPYAWAEARGYERAAERGSVGGHLVVEDPQAPTATAAGAWVGLAAAPYSAELGKTGPTMIDWQTDGKHYQYWARVDATGRFTIPHVRAGIYTLYAFTEGVLGDFSRADVRVEPGVTTNLGELNWVPVRYGRQLWEIGIPDRSAGEFRHGDHYWQWGLYNLYPQEFPDDVDFVIGKSDWRRDWNYAQPPRPDGNGRWSDTTWRIRFNIDRPLRGTATLRLAICGARGGTVDVSLNGMPIGSTGELPESGVMHRDGIRSASLTERDVAFDASLLKRGENVFALRKHARAWTDGVLYDYLRLELDSQKAFTPR